jgi:hypothetical protein
MSPSNAGGAGTGQLAAELVEFPVEVAALRLREERDAFENAERDRTG